MRKLDIYFVSAFSFSLFFPTRIPTYVLELYALYIILDSILERSTLKNYQVNLRRFPAELSALTIFFLTNLLSIILSDRTEGAWHQIEKRLPFFLIPLTIVMRKDHFSNLAIERTLTFFLFGGLSATVVNFLRAIYRSTSWIKGEFMFNASVEEHRSFVEAILFGGNFFFYEEYSAFMHPTYFGLYLLYSVYLLSIFLRKSQIKPKQRALVFLIIGWLVMNIFLLSSRAVLLSTLLLLPATFIRSGNKGQKRRLVLIPVSVVLFGAIIFSNPRSLDLLSNSDAFSSSPRILILKAGSKVIRDNFVFGTGVVDLDYEMRDAYKEIGFNEGVTLGYNLHNQYLETLAGAGILGLLSLFLMIGTLARKAIDQKNTMLLGMIALLVFNFLFESILNVYSGIVFFCFMSSILIFYRGQKETTH